MKQTIGLLLLVVYAFFFASANLFYHSHQLADGTVVHSHIFAGCKTHNHTSSQLQIIDQLNTVTYDQTEPVQVLQVFLHECGTLVVARVVSALPFENIRSFSLRAPPIL